MKSHEEWDKLDYAALEADAEKDAHILEAERLKQADSLQLEHKHQPKSALNQNDSRPLQRRPEVRVSKKDRKLEQASIEVARGEAQVLHSRAAVARFKARRRAKIKATAPEVEENEALAAEVKEAKAAADLDWITQQTDKIVDGRNQSLELFDAGEFQACLMRVQTTLTDIAEVKNRLPSELQQRSEDEQKYGHEHGHGHGHGGCHGHAHGRGSCDDRDGAEEGEGSSVLEKIGKVVRRAHVQTLVLAAQVYINRCESVAAVNALRDALLLERSLEHAWVLRAKAFLMMGAPLLAELHLTQSEVGAESPRVQALLEMCRSRTKFYHARPLEEVVARTLAEEGVNDSLSFDARVTICEKLLEEGKLLRNERFLHSASIKLASVLKLVYSSSEDGHVQGSSSENSLEVVEVEALLNYAACSIHRSTRLMQAITYCSRVVQLKAAVFDPPEALLLRAQAFRGMFFLVYL